MNKLLTLLMAFTIGNAVALAEPKKSQNREISGFTKLECVGSIRINYYQSKDYKVVAHCEEGDINEIKTNISGKKLKIFIESREKSMLGGFIKYSDENTVKNAYVDVYSPNIEEITRTGSGHFASKTDMNVQGLSITTQGSGVTEIGHLTCSELKAQVLGSGKTTIGKTDTKGNHNISVQGSGHIDINGTCSKAKIKVHGSGSVKYNGANTKTDVDVHGSGNVSGEIFTDIFNGTTYGSGSIKMHGKANQINTNKSGTGKAIFTND